jgi:hypothetical protein
MSAEVQLYYGQATETLARVYARWTGAPPAPSDPPLELYGPESPYAATLRARYPFVRRPGAADPTPEASIAEPCFWTPTAPYVYRYEVRVAGSSPKVGIFGIRRLSVVENRLTLDRKVWVLRAALAEPAGEVGLRRDAGQDSSLADWHETPLSAVVTDPSDRLCEAASRLGVLLVARVSSDRPIAEELRRLARWPAVGIAILASPAGGVELREHARNLLLAQTLSADAPAQPAAWAQLVFCQVEEPASYARQVADWKLPVVATRGAHTWSTLAEARAGCDRLQRDLATAGVQMAGYVV